MTTCASTMADLFAPEPAQWGFRGDPHVWAAMRDRLTEVPIAATAAACADVLRVTFHDLVGAHPEDEGDIVDGRAVYREEFNHGGMSGGGVNLWVWRERLMPLLVSRAEKAVAGRTWAGDPDDTALLRETPLPPPVG